jgi:hypothetical protein
VRLVTEFGFAFDTGKIEVRRKALIPRLPSPGMVVIALDDLDDDGDPVYAGWVYVGEPG